MSNFEYSIDGIGELEKAIKRSPEKIKTETAKFIARGLAEYRRIISRNPWKIGSGGGGAPVATGNLRDTHFQEQRPFEGKIYPTADYAVPVHKGRPWLEYAVKTGEKEIQRLQVELLNTIVNDLAK